MMFSSRMGASDRRFDLESGALLDDNSKSRRKGQSFLTRQFVRLLWSILGAARKRWFTSTLLVWVLFREMFPRGPSSQTPRAPWKMTAGAPVPIPRAGTGPETYPYPKALDLVVVCGHAVYRSGDYSRAGEESSWYLEDYQKVQGRAETFLEHAKVGVMEAANNPKALLVFSGGKTRKSAGSLGEGTSYWEVARANSWFGKVDTVATRAFTEDFARDSLENVMFSITRFHELTGKVPRKLTVVGYEFKRERFVDLHRAALRFPRDRFVYVGTGAAGTEERSSASEVDVRAQFRADPYGCSGELRRKRRARDPFNVGQPYSRTNPELEPLLSHCGPELFDGKLPWPKTKERSGAVPSGDGGASSEGKGDEDAEKGEDEGADGESSKQHHSGDDV
tara:strand:- start:724 stop:1902 length:1179 start_codon:yes stop_codon:yes gene_type:complete